MIGDKNYLIAYNDGERTIVDLVDSRELHCVLGELARENNTPFVLDLSAAFAGFVRCVGADSTRTFTMPEVAACAGVDQHKAEHWARRGILPSPAALPARGSGQLRRWTYEQAFLAAVLGCLNRNGLQWKAIRSIQEGYTRAMEREPVTTAAQ